MNVHEYQSKKLFKQYGITVPKGSAATTQAEARQAASELGGDGFVVKAQIHTGGRGKGGGFDGPVSRWKTAEIDG